MLANKHSLAIFGEQTSIADQLGISEEPHSTQQTRLLVSFKDSCKKFTNNLNDMGAGVGGVGVLFGKLSDDFWMAK